MQQVLLMGIVLMFWSPIAIGDQLPLDNSDAYLEKVERKIVQEHESAVRLNHSMPDNDSKIIELSYEAISKLRIDAGFGWGIFNGSIYNGNDDYAIEQVIIKLIPSQIAGTTTETPLESKEYTIDVTVPPLSKSALSMYLDSDGTQEFEWHLIGVRGHKTDIKK
jgi:hypothetical protein